LFLLAERGEPKIRVPSGLPFVRTRTTRIRVRTGKFGSTNQSMMSETRPAPTVRPPSRIAKRIVFSMAIGVRSSTSMATLSPGMTISTPSGSLTEPVTSVVRK